MPVRTCDRLTAAEMWSRFGATLAVLLCVLCFVAAAVGLVLFAVLRTAPALRLSILGPCLQLRWPQNDLLIRAATAALLLDFKDCGWSLGLEQAAGAGRSSTELTAGTSDAVLLSFSSLHGCGLLLERCNCCKEILLVLLSSPIPS